MFNWTTTTILNSLKDYTTGLDLVKVWEGPESLANGKAGFSGEYKVIKIKRDHTFESRYITNVYKAFASEPVLCEMTVDCAKILSLVNVQDAPAHVRLSFYIGLEGSEESIYANDWYQKGKPFSIGFDIAKGETNAQNIVDKIIKNANKFGVVIYGKKVFDIVDNGDKTITLKGTHEYQRFKMAAVAVDDVISEELVDFFEGGVDGTVSEGQVFKIVKNGSNGFGTSHQLIKDLRLPTAHHNKWLQLKEDEKPVVGAKYNQYIITYCAPSMANPGFSVIGQHQMSVTTHVFWVNQDIDSNFQTLLAEVASIEEVNSVSNGVATLKAKATADAGKNYSANHEQKVVDAEKKAAAAGSGTTD